MTWEMNEEIYKLIVDQMDGAVITDAEGRYVYVNESWSRYTGFSLEEVKGKYVRDVIPSTRLHEALETGQSIIGIPVPLGQGNERKSFSNYFPIFDQGKLIAGFIMVMFNDLEHALWFSNKVNNLKDELDYYRQELKILRGAKYSIENIVGNSPAILETKAQIRRAARSNSTVLIEGETGCGKELVAHAIHELSLRSGHSFVKVNCAAIPQELMESEFFGYESGAFTGANKSGKKGKFELANRGSIFLDEIDQMPMLMQSKLLRVLQEREIERVGGKESIPVDVRLVAATNASLERLVEEKRFRKDMYYRLNVIKIKIPPLRKRKEDIFALTADIIAKLNDQLGLKVEGVSEEVLDRFLAYDWPGNIRELQNVLERAMNMGYGVRLLGWNCFQNYFEGKPVSKYVKQGTEIGKQGASIKAVFHEIERRMILDTLQENQYNVKRTAELLGYSRTQIYKKMKEYGEPITRV